MYNKQKNFKKGNKKGNFKKGNKKGNFKKKKIDYSENGKYKPGLKNVVGVQFVNQHENNHRIYWFKFDGRKLNPQVGQIGVVMSATPHSNRSERQRVKILKVEEHKIDSRFGNRKELIEIW